MYLAFVLVLVLLILLSSLLGESKAAARLRCSLSVDFLSPTNSAQFRFFFVERVVESLPGMDYSVAIRPYFDVCHWPFPGYWLRVE